jgi:hypothetical protein
VTCAGSIRRIEPHLKHDPGLLRDHRNRSALAHHLGELVEELKDVRLTASEERLESVLPARVPHVFGDEALPALRTLPEGREVG